MKTACIIQGDIRENFDIVLSEILKHFSLVIVSTWYDQKDKIPEGDFVLILNEKPQVTGYSHRNYQRYSTARGIEKAKELAVDYILKWRTDMLPTKLDVNQLIEWANYDIPNGLKSRIVTCAFRNLTVYEDWFSSMPDLFAFGHTETMELLWGDNDFDYTKIMNPPKQMLIDEGIDWISQNENGALWCAESELYAIFKDRLHRKLGIKLSHEVIAKDYMRLFDHNKLGIVWFGNNGKFRSVAKSWEHPWWHEYNWLKQNKVIDVHKGYKIKNIMYRMSGKMNLILMRIEILKQKIYYYRYKNVAK